MAHKMSISCHKINCCLSANILKGTSNLTSHFFNVEFGEYLQGVILSKEPLLITGDLNFHVDDCSDKDAAKFKDLLLEFGLQQHVNVPTHTLDRFITWMSDNTTLDVPVASYYISDHTFVVCQLNTPKPATVMETITYLKYKQIDIEKFKNDIEQSCLYTMTESICNKDTCDMETMAAQYNTTLRKITDDHAPEKTKTVKKKPAMPWYNDEIKGLRRDRWKAERQWLKHRGDPIKNVTCREEYRLVCNRYRSATDEAKTEYYSGKFRHVLEIKRNPLKSLNHSQNHYNKNNTPTLTH